MTLLKKFLPLVILGSFLVIAAVIKFNPPEAQRRPGASGPQMVVETQTVAARDYTVRIESYGTVQPRVRSMLVAQVSGQIVETNPNVRDGGFFERGDVLLRIDDRDYAADVSIAEAALADAQQGLAEAEAQTQQAREDWARLGDSGEPTDLVLRIPQLKAAQARVRSAESSLQKARLDLERTRIRAPFAGRVLSKFVDLGQVVSVNTPLAEIYATDVVEIRLPLRNRDLQYIELPETYRHLDEPERAGGHVEIQSELANQGTWDAELVRTEGAIDETARQLHVIAQISDPFGTTAAGRTPLKIGQYVTARLAGMTLQDALVVPNNTIYQGTYVYVVEDGVLRRRDIDIAWQNDAEAIVAAGIAPGDELVLTPLGQVTSGVRVSILGDDGGDGGAVGRPRPAGSGARGETP